MAYEALVVNILSQLVSRSNVVVTKLVTDLEICRSFVDISRVVFVALCYGN